MDLIEYVIVVIGAVWVLMYLKHTYSEVASMKSDADGNDYLVQISEKNPKESANILGRLNLDILKLIDHLERSHPTDKGVERLRARYRPESLSEGNNKAGYTSYSLNKGEQLVFCLRTDGEFVDENVLRYVAIHELAHVYTVEVGHTSTFWSNFQFLLTEAIVAGVYRKVDYTKRPVDYCGVHIKSSVI